MKRTQGYVNLLRYENNYLVQTFTSQWSSITVKSSLPDKSRQRVLDHMVNELMSVLKSIQALNFHETLDPLCKLTALSKLLIDNKPALHFYQMLACLLLNLGKFDLALKLFDLARDISHDSQNLAQELLCYEWLGRTLQEKREYAKALICFKKMLQLAWIMRIQDYEFRAYKHIAKQYFYMDMVEKSNGYTMKALLGDHESLDSHPRQISEEHYWYKTRSATAQGKFDRMGYRVTRENATKNIDMTQDYSKLLKIIQSQG